MGAVRLVHQMPPKQTGSMPCTACRMSHLPWELMSEDARDERNQPNTGRRMVREGCCVKWWDREVGVERSLVRREEWREKRDAPSYSAKAGLFQQGSKKVAEYAPGLSVPNLIPKHISVVWNA